MKTIITLLVLFFFTSVVNGIGCGTSWIITDGNSSLVFTPATLTITVGDTVKFELGSIHGAVEVSQAVWNANNNNPLNGGFSVPYGGGTVLPTSLLVGTYYYVCPAHYAMGEKGIIIVNPCTNSTNDLSQNSLATIFPNPATNLLTITTTSSQPSQIILYDIASRQLMEERFSGSATLNIENLAKGIYLYEVRDEKGVVKRGKVVKE
jgi:plastocyanin